MKQTQSENIKRRWRQAVLANHPGMVITSWGFFLMASPNKTYGCNGMGMVQTNPPTKNPSRDCPCSILLSHTSLVFAPFITCEAHPTHPSKLGVLHVLLLSALKKFSGHLTHFVPFPSQPGGMSAAMRTERDKNHVKEKHTIQ